MAALLDTLCKKLLKMMKVCYNGENRNFYYNIHEYFPVKKYEYIMKMRSTHYKKKEDSNSDLLQKSEAVALILETIVKTKSIFTDKDEQFSLVNFYKRNQDNLRGVFESTIEIVFEKSIENIEEKDIGKFC